MNTNRMSQQVLNWKQKQRRKKRMSKKSWNNEISEAMQKEDIDGTNVTDRIVYDSDEVNDQVSCRLAARIYI